MKLFPRREAKRFELNLTDVELAICNFLKLPKVKLLQNDFITIERDQYKKLVSIFKNISDGIPIAQILGKKEFFSLDFLVNKKTLIPRPETEMLVELVLNEIFKLTLKNPTIIDVGTGSGAIAITLAKKFPNLKVFATDKSKLALKVAKQNAKFHRVNIRFIKSDLLKFFKKRPIDVNIMVANLPYVSRKNYFALEKNIYFEPRGAIEGGKTGTRLIRRLFEQINKYELTKSLETILLEIEPGQTNLIKKFVKQIDFDAQFLTDQFGIERFCIARRYNLDLRGK